MLILIKMKLKKYLKYKDSWIDWIWEIPEDWEVRKLKFINKLQWWYAFKSDKFSEEWNDIIRIWNIKDDINFNDAKRYPESIKIHRDFKIKNNDVLIALTWATIWKVWKVDNYTWKAYINQRVAKLSWLNNYYYYLLKSDFIKKQIELIWNWSAQENISNWQIEDFNIPFNNKQQNISSFLDSKTSQIEKLIEKDKKLIALLKERRVSLINKAVTKGLDNSVEMKDSWVEWIWEIPEGWEIRRMKFNAKINPIWKKVFSNGRTKITFLPMEEVSEKWEYNIENQAEYNDVSSWYTYFKNDDVIVAKITPCFENWKGAVLFNLINWIWFWSTEFHVIRKYTFMSENYMYYFTKSHIFRKIWEAFMQGSAGQKRIWTDFIQDFPFPTPKKETQNYIVEFLNKETENIDNHIKKVEGRIELYEEYRKSLIYNVVTGKVEV